MFQKILPLNNDNGDFFIKMEESQQRFSKIDINHKSTLYNYSILVALIIVIGIIHSLVSILYSKYKIMNKVQGTHQVR